MPVIPKFPIRELKKDAREAAVRAAFAQLRKLTGLNKYRLEEVLNYAMCHPKGRRQFLHYCAQENTWRADRIDDWEYCHMLSLKELAEKRLLWEELG